MKFSFQAAQCPLHMRHSSSIGVWQSRVAPLSLSPRWRSRSCYSDVLGLRRIFYFCTCSQDVFAQEFKSTELYKKCLDVHSVLWAGWHGGGSVTDWTQWLWRPFPTWMIWGFCVGFHRRGVWVYSHISFEPRRPFPAHQSYLSYILNPKLKQNKLIAKWLAVHRATNYN